MLSLFFCTLYAGESLNVNVLFLDILAMHRVGSAGNTSNSSRPRKEKRLTYVLNDADDKKVG